MKKTVSIFLLTLAIALVMSVAASAVTLYAPDGRTLEKPESEVELYKSLGWYDYPVAKMYSLDGRTLICKKANVEANKKVGWYEEPMVKMYSLDGRTLICKKANVEANKKVGWYEEPMVKMYSLDGRTLICKKANVEANKKVGWYEEPMVKMYSLDGRTLICKKANVEANKKVGWYEDPVVKFDYTYGYGELLDRLKLAMYALSNGDWDYDPDNYFEYGTFFGIEEIFYSEGSSLYDVGYIIKDFSGDGIPELLITGDERILAAYTLVDGKPELTLIGWSRSRFCLRTDGTIYYEGADSAFESYEGIYKFNYDGTISCFGAYLYKGEYDYYTGEEYIQVYYSPTGDFYTYGAYYPVPEKEWGTLYKEYGNNFISSDCIVRFSNYNRLDRGVEIWYADDIIDNFTNYHSYVYPNLDKEWLTDFVFITNEVVTDFTIYRITSDEYYVNGKLSYDIEAVYKLDTFTPGKPLSASLYLMDAPAFAISYVDANGKTVYSTIMDSWVDSSIWLSPFTK